MAALLSAGVRLGLGTDAPAAGARDALANLAAARREGVLDDAALLRLATLDSAAVARLSPGGLEPGAPAWLYVFRPRPQQTFLTRVYVDRRP